MNYYNEHDPFAAAWLRKLIEAGLIPAGVVDERSIEDVTPNELERYTQCHFFAGIGGWSLALQLAGVPATTRLWSGSCPCQPFSSAGKGGGFDDERYLWPAFHHLIRVCRPAIVVGEQVASPDGLRWCDLVQDDLEVEGYAFGKADLCAAGVGAPHIRQRLYWVGRLGLPHSPGWQQGQPPSPPMGHGGPIEPAGGALGLAHPVHVPEHRLAGAVPCEKEEDAERPRNNGPERCSEAGGMAHPDHQGPQGWILGRNSPGECAPGEGCVELQGVPNPLHGFWRDADWLFCRDGKWRPVEPGSFPLVDGFSKGMGRGSDPCPPIDPYSAEARVMRLRGYGNALTVQVAASFLRACEQSIQEIR